jgi:hypothetical protein
MAWSLSDFEKGVFGVLTVVARREETARISKPREGDASIVAISR